MFLKRSMSAVLPLVLIASALMLNRALAATVFNVKMPVAGFVADACTGELVDLAGELHTMDTLTTDHNGGVHHDIYFNQHVKGTGETSGAVYLLNESKHTTINTNSGDTVTETMPKSVELVAQGQAPNLLLHELIHMTVNPDGTITSSVDTFSTECR